MKSATERNNRREDNRRTAYYASAVAAACVVVAVVVFMATVAPIATAGVVSFAVVGLGDLLTDGRSRPRDKS